MKKTKLGNFEKYKDGFYVNGKICVAKETEKAIQLRFDGEAYLINIGIGMKAGVDDDITEYWDGRTYWLPKSQITIEDDIIEIPKWLIRDKGFEDFTLYNDDILEKHEDIIRGKLEAAQSAVAEFKNKGN